MKGLNGDLNSGQRLLSSVYTVASSEILAEDRKWESTAKEKIGRKNTRGQITTVVDKKKFPFLFRVMAFKRCFVCV